MNKTNNIFTQTMDSIKWSYGYTILPKLLSPIVQLILARLLIPADFGLVAIAALVIAFVGAIRETGFSRAFIQRDDDEKTLFNTVFWMSSFSGVCFYFIIFLTAPLIAKFFHNPDSMWIIRIMGIQMILSSLNTCHNSSLIKKLEYKRIFKINLIPALTPLLVTVPLAYMGYGVWSLVIGHLTGSIIRTFALWYFVPIRPLFDIDKIILKKILYFGSLCSMEAVLGWCYVWGDKVIVGYFLSASQLGIYSIASVIIALIFSSVFSPLSIIYPLLCGIKNDMDAIRSILYKLFNVVSSISLLLGIFVFFNVDIIPYLFGEKWKGIEVPLGILAITQSLSYIVTITIPDALKAIEKVDIMPKFQSIKLLYTLPALIVGVTYGGLVGFCYAKLATVIVGFIIHVILGIKYLDLNLKKISIVFYPKLIAFIITAMTLISLKISLQLNNIYTETAKNCLLGFITYCIVLAIADRRGMIDSFRLFKKVLPVKQHS